MSDAEAEEAYIIQEAGRAFPEEAERLAVKQVVEELTATADLHRRALARQSEENLHCYERYRSFLKSKALAGEVTAAGIRNDHANLCSVSEAPRGRRAGRVQRAQTRRDQNSRSRRASRCDTS